MTDIVLTFDVDWAPDFAIDFVAEQLLDRRLKATWFITHQSPALERLREHPELFELGIHPNFLPGSTHGPTPGEVLRYCMKLVPEATSLRTHGLYQSTPLLDEVLSNTPITRDVSLFLPHASLLQPVQYDWKGRTLLRIPYYWEDDLEMERGSPCWRLADLKTGQGLKVFDFHPIHVYLNSATMRSYTEVKQIAPGLDQVAQSDASGYIFDGEGTRTMFMEVIDHLAATGRSLRIKDITLD
jgi:hypothetical protein